MIDCITAISTAATAIFAGFMLLIAYRKYIESFPVITVIDKGGDTRREFRSFKISIENEEKNKYFIKKIRVIKPKGCKVSRNHGSEPAWEDSLLLSEDKSSMVIDIIFSTESPLKGLVFNTDVTVALKSKTSFVRRINIQSKVAD